MHTVSCASMMHILAGAADVAEPLKLSNQEAQSEEVPLMKVLPPRIQGVSPPAMHMLHTWHHTSLAVHPNELVASHDCSDLLF